MVGEDEYCRCATNTEYHIFISFFLCTVKNPGNPNSEKLDLKVSFPLIGFRPTFHSFHSVNWNWDNSDSPLTRTKFRIP